MGTFKRRVNTDFVYTRNPREEEVCPARKRAIYRNYHIHVRTDIMAQFISELPTGKCVNPLKI